jgi:Alkaline phosphatase
MSETLIIVTSDHSSALTYAGFATPKNYSILGMDKFTSDVNKKPYQLLMYASGPGYQHFNESLARADPKNSYHKATIPMVWGNHDATDVPLYADGSLANVLFGGSIDQSYVAHAIAFAMCLFQYEKRCENSFLVDEKLTTVDEVSKEDDYDDEYFLTTENIETSGDDVIITNEILNETSPLSEVSEVVQDLRTFSHLEDSKSNFIDANLSSTTSFSILLSLPCIIVSIINLF